MNNKISVVIPMYNAFNTLDRCLSSLLNQSYKNLEIIIVDDGSLDASLEKVKEYASKDNRIKYYVQKHAGVSAARNYGLKFVSGDFIQFVDSDDDLDLKYFEKMLKLMENDEIDMAVCNNSHPFFTTYLEDRVYDMRNRDDFLEFYQMTYAPTLPWNKLIRRKVIENVKFNVNLKFAEDEVFFCSLSKNIKKIATTHEVLYHYFFAKKEDEGGKKSAISDIMQTEAFWINKTSFYYKGLLCIPPRKEAFDEAIKLGKIPFNDSSDLVYQRVFDFAFYQYAAYAGMGVPEEAMRQEMMNILTDESFIKSMRVQNKYGIKFLEFDGKELEEKVKNMNHFIYSSYLDIYQNKKNLKATYVAMMIFTKFFLDQSLPYNDSVNLCNKFYKDLKLNKSEEAKYVNEKEIEKYL